MQVSLLREQVPTDCDSRTFPFEQVAVDEQAAVPGGRKINGKWHEMRICEGRALAEKSIPASTKKYFKFGKCSKAPAGISISGLARMSKRSSSGNLPSENGCSVAIELWETKRPLTPAIALADRLPWTLDIASKSVDKILVSLLPVKRSVSTGGNAFPAAGMVWIPAYEQSKAFSD